MDRIYMDNNATTAPDPRVVEAMLQALERDFGNPSSSHWFGQRAAALVEEARNRVGALIKADPLAVYFTSGATESNNAAIRGAAAVSRPGQRVVYSAVEHPSVLAAVKILAGRGFETVELPVDGAGRADLAKARELIDENTCLVTVMAANNETGATQPVADLAELAHAKGALFHTDAVQYAGKLEIDVGAWNADMLSISAHKFYGPKGTGALYVRPGLKLPPLLPGGGQEHGLRGGTENVPGIVGMGAAADIAVKEMQEWTERTWVLRDRLETELLAEVDRTIVNGPKKLRLPNTLSVSFPGAEGEALLMSLDLKGVAVSAGSACHSGRNEPSRVLLAMGIPPDRCNATLRISLGKDTTEDEVERARAIIVEQVKKLRALSGR